MIARVSAAAARGQLVGAVGRAKALLDALHDRRPDGITYAQLEAEPPLPDDDPASVNGLGVEVQASRSHQVEYRLGPSLEVRGEPLRIDVGCAAPNDIAGTRAEQVRIGQRRAS